MNFMGHYHPYLAPRFEFGGHPWLGLDTGMDTTAREWKEVKLVTTSGLT